MNFGSITRSLGKAGLFIKKHADTIEIVAGGLCVIAGTVVLVKDAEKVADAKHKVEEAKFNGESKPEIAKTAVVEYAKATWKGVGLTTAGLIFMGVSHASVHKQLEAVSATAAATAASFNSYRKNVVADQGEDKDLQYLTGGVATEVEVKQDGTTVITTTPINNPDIKKNYIPHSIMFDEHNPNWQKGAQYNRIYLEQNLRYLNQRLATYGYLTENQIRETIGEEWTVAGQASGIMYNNPDGTTNQLSFGIERDNEMAKAFREGSNPSFLIILQKANGDPIDNNIYDQVKWPLY